MFSFLGKCVTCERYEHPLGTQMMSDLPFDRVNPCKPFLHTGILNSTPLYPLSDDPDDVQALTPGHFLVGEPLKVPARMEPPTRTNFTVKRIWAEAQNMKENFWKIWVNEYLPTLQPRQKWRKEIRDYKMGQLVIIKDENLPPAQWLLGRIIELIKGSDDLVRSVKLRTSSGQLSRLVQKICVLPISEYENETTE